MDVSSLPHSLYPTHIFLVMTSKAVSLNTPESPSSHPNSTTTLFQQMATDGEMGPDEPGGICFGSRTP